MFKSGESLQWMPDRDRVDYQIDYDQPKPPPVDESDSTNVPPERRDLPYDPPQPPEEEVERK